MERTWYNIQITMHKYINWFDLWRPEVYPTCNVRFHSNPENIKYIKLLSERISYTLDWIQTG